MSVGAEPVQLQYRRSDADQANTFSTLGGNRTQSTLGVPIGLNITRGRQLHNINVNFSHTSSHSMNRFAGVTNVAAEAGIAGAATDPFAWGVPMADVGGWRRDSRLPMGG